MAVGSAENAESREVYVVDDSRDIRTSLHKLLFSIGIRACCFGAAEDFIENIDRLRPGPILLDVLMPDIDGLEMMSVLRKSANAWPVIVMTGHGDVPLAVSAMKLGAVEFLQKPFKLDELEQALGQAFGALDLWLEADRRRERVFLRFATLTPREREIACHLTGGASNKAVALRLDLSVRTVEMHRASLMRKLGVANIVELAEVLALLSDKKGGPAYG